MKQMSSLAKTLRALAVVAGLSGITLATGANAHSACGVIGISGQASSVNYDPFEPSGLASTNIVMKVSRINPIGGGKTDYVNFYLKASPSTGSAANGIEIIPVSVYPNNNALVGGRNLNIFYNTPVSAAPTMLPVDTPVNPQKPFISLKFSGNAGSADSLDVTFQVKFPANLNINASQTLAFDAVYACKFSGAADNKKTGTGTRSNALIFPVTTLSALRTYYAGTALDFGEIGLITQADYSQKNTGDSNYVYVQSSGAYDITLSSQNGFVLHNVNGVTGDNDKVKYKVEFLGTPLSGGTPGQIALTKKCMRAGLASESKQLPIKATLMEAGAGKNPANYLDNLTVTLTPKAYGESGVDQCGS